MAFYIVTGKLGTGKSLVVVNKIKEYLEKGRPVVTNLDIDLPKLINPTAKKTRFIRVPDKPTVYDLKAAGRGKPSHDKTEDNNGLMALDELGTWFNSRDWNAEGRKELINYLAHIRKLGWDVMFIIQSVEVLDKQAREMFAELVVRCTRLDRLPIPLLTSLLKLGGIKLTLPRTHLATVRLGDNPTGYVLDRWAYRGTEVQHAYDTNQVFQYRAPGEADYYGPHSILPPYYQTLRTRSPRTARYYMRLTKVYSRKFSRVVMLALGLFAGSMAGTYFAAQPTPQALPTSRAAQSSFSSSGDLPQASEPLISLDRITSIRTIQSFRVPHFYVFNTQSGPVDSLNLQAAGYSIRSIRRCLLKLSYRSESRYVRCDYGPGRNYHPDPSTVSGTLQVAASSP